MGIFDWLRRGPKTDDAYAASSLPPVEDIPDDVPASMTKGSPQSAVVDASSWAETFTPGVASLVPLGGTSPSYSHINVPEGYELVKARTEGESNVEFGMPSTDELQSHPRSLMYDPFALVEQMGFRDRPTAVTYGTLDAMVWKVPIIQAIIQTRINQVSAFCSPQHHKFETGFRVKMRDIEDKPSPADKKFMRAMEAMLIQCGTVATDSRVRDGLEKFVRKSVRDSMVFDQVNWEIVPGRNGAPAAWYAVDAKSIRLANTGKLYPEDDPDAVYAVQIYDNIIINEYTSKEMTFGIRNPRTDIRTHGYGTSELEMLVTIVTSILWSMQYNQNMFAQGSLQKGLLNLVGTIPERQLRAFKHQWVQQLAGVNNAWRTPITNAEKIEWINMQNSNKDMEFSAWLDFLIKVACSVYNIDPIEVNFKYGQSGGQKSMFEGANKSKVLESKDRGLKPLLKFLGREIDKHIIWPINPNFTFEFVGLESQTPKELADLMTQRVRTIYTIDEVRAEQDLEPLEDGLGKLILDANWMNARKEVQAKKDAENAQKKQEAQLQAEAAALASATAGKLSQEEIATVAQQLATPPQQPAPPGGPGGPGGKPGKPGGGSSTPGVKAPTAPAATPPVMKSIDVEL